MAVTGTAVIVPDTQNYYQQNKMTVFHDQMKWIVDNKVSRNIFFMAHVGDVVDQDQDAEYVAIKPEIYQLNGVIPYVFTTGNHDYTGASTLRNTKINNHLAFEDNPLNVPLGGTYLPGESENNYIKLTAPDGRKILVVSLEFFPRTDRLAWANSIVKSNPDYLAILNTHANVMEADGGASVYELGMGVGGLLWDSLFNDSDRFFAAVNGHDLDNDDDDGLDGPMAVGLISETTKHGNTIHQMLFNAQEQANGGNGYMRLLEFLDDGVTIQVRTYSPTLDKWLTDARNEYTLEIPAINAVDNIDAGLVAHWKLDEKTGTSFVDSSGNSHDGALVGAGNTFDVNSITGKIGRAYQLDGSVGHYGKVPVHSDFNFGASDFSIAFSAKLPVGGALTAQYAGSCSDGWHKSGWAVHFSPAQPSEDFVFYTFQSDDGQGTNGVHQKSSIADLTPYEGAFHDFLITRSGPTAKIYIDGVLQPLFVSQSHLDPTDSTTDLQIGSFGGNAGELAIDEFRVYNRVVTPTEAVKLSAFRPADYVSDLLGYWKFDETTGTAIKDSSGNNYDGLITGGTMDSLSIAGRVGGAINFTGAESINVATVPVFTGQEFTISAVIKHDGTAATRAIVEAGPDAVFSLLLFSSGKFAFQAARTGSNMFALTGTPTIVTNQETHITVSYDNGTAKIYVDGVLTTTDTTGSGDLKPFTYIRMGQNRQGAQPYPGMLDELRLYDRVLAPEDVAALASFSGVHSGHGMTFGMGLAL